MTINNNVTPIIKPSQKNRFSDQPLDLMIAKYPNKRIAENHGIEFFTKHLSDLDFRIGLKCDRKLKKSSVALVKPTGLEVRDYGDLDFVIQVSAIQVSYHSLIEAKLLAEKLIQVWDNENNKIVKFPTGCQKKGLSVKEFEIWKKYDINRFDGFDNVIAAGCNHVCSSCNYSFSAINMPKPERPYTCPKCDSNMVSSRVNYNYRTDNTGKHWGTMSSEELLLEIDVYSPNFKFLSKENRLKALELQGISKEDVADINAVQIANFEVKTKADDYDKLSYKELRRLAQNKNLDLPNMRKQTILDALRTLNLK